MQSVVTEGQHAAAAGIHHLLSADPHPSPCNTGLSIPVSILATPLIQSDSRTTDARPYLGNHRARKILLKITQECPACLHC
jgi:hypothetical protein